MKTPVVLSFLLFSVSLGALAAGNTLDWRYGRPGVLIVTNAPSEAEFSAQAVFGSNTADRVTELEGHANDPLPSYVVTNGGTATLSLASLGALVVSGHTKLGVMAANSAGGNAQGSVQAGWNDSLMGSWYVNSMGAWQIGYTGETTGIAVTNLGAAAVQIFHLDSPNLKALTTTEGDGSLMLGAGVSSNKHALVVGDGAFSHGAGSITAAGGFWGSWNGLTGIGDLNAVTNFSSPTLTGLALQRYTNAVANAYTVSQVSGAPASVLGRYNYKATSVYTNGLGWQIYVESSPLFVVYVNSLPPLGSGTYTFMSGAVPRNSSSGGGIGTGTVQLDYAYSPAAYPTTILSTNGLEGAALRTASVPDSALATAPITASITNGLGLSTLLSFSTNASGSVTSQVWRTGGSVVTNFFSSGGTAVYSSEWVRPAGWPVGSGYTVDSWLSCEPGKIKALVVPSARGATAFQGDIFYPSGVVTNRYYVDWLGDGTAVSNYSDLALAVYNYPTNLIGTAVPVILGTTAANDSVHFILRGGMSGYSTFLRTNTCDLLEVVASGTNNLGRQASILVEYSSSLTSVVCYNQILDYMSFRCGFGDSWNLKNAVLSNCSLLGTYVFLRCHSLNNVTLIGEQTGTLGYGFFAYTPSLFKEISGQWDNASINVFGFSGVYAINTPAVTNIGIDFAYSARRLTNIAPMPNLQSVGTRAFNTCNLDFSAITNFVLSLENDVSAKPQTVDFRLNPGSAEFGAWLTDPETPGSALIKPGWSFLY